jgi:hypothetical protein
VKEESAQPKRGYEYRFKTPTTNKRYSLYFTTFTIDEKMKEREWRAVGKLGGGEP